MEDTNVCVSVIPDPEFYSKSSDIEVHSTLLQLTESTNIPEGSIFVLNKDISLQDIVPDSQNDIHTVINVVGLEHYCRICGTVNESSRLIQIFQDQDNQLELDKKINNCLHLQVQKDDRLPQQVCNTCLCYLNICHQLLEISHAADSKLRQLFLLPQLADSNDVCLSIPVDVMTNLNSLHNDHNQEQDHDCGKNIRNPSAESSTYINDQEQNSNNGNCEAGKVERKEAEDENDVKVVKNSKTIESLLCHICGKHFKNSANLQAHKHTHLADSVKKKHHCSLCPKAFRSKFHLSEHMNVHNGVNPYSCSQCDKLFHKRAQLRQHSLVHIHDSKKVACEVCGLRFTRKSNLQAHTKIHAENRTFDCRLCNKPFPSFSAMLSHRKQHSQEDIKSRISLGLVSNKEQLYTCEVCGKVLTNKTSLLSHLENHKPVDSIKKYNCADCGKVLRSSKSLAYHRRSQHSCDRPYCCSFCSEGFMSKKLLLAHENRHTGQKPFKCEVCWRCFRSRSNLTQHMQKHNGEKNFECSICNKKFFRKGTLIVHNRKHTGEKPFICDQCGRPFAQKNDMLKHQKTHLKPNSRSRTCELCMSVFSSNKELIKHKEEAHKDNVNVVPLIITSNMFETHIITEDGQKFLISVENFDENNLTAPSSTSI